MQRKIDAAVVALMVVNNAAETVSSVSYVGGRTVAVAVAFVTGVQHRFGQQGDRQVTFHRV